MRGYLSVGHGRSEGVTSLPLMEAPRIPPREIRCSCFPICRRLFRKDEGMLTHLVDDHEPVGEEMKCPRLGCGRLFLSYDALRTHCLTTAYHPAPPDPAPYAGAAAEEEEESSSFPELTREERPAGEWLHRARPPRRPRDPYGDLEVEMADLFTPSAATVGEGRRLLPPPPIRHSFRCVGEGCFASYDTRDGLELHLKQKHDSHTFVAYLLEVREERRKRREEQLH